MPNLYTKDIPFDVAQNSAIKCCGINAPLLGSLTTKNAKEVRNAFLANVCYNGRDSHWDIVNVLIYIGYYI